MIIRLLDKNENEDFNADITAVVEEVGADSVISYLCATKITEQNEKRTFVKC